MTKLSELTIEQREWPLIVHSNGSDLIHISRSNGHNGDEYYTVTDCNRTLSYPSTTQTLDPYFGWKYCPKCGTERDFKIALADQAQVMEEHFQKREAERKAEMAEWRKEQEENKRQLAALAASLEKDGYIIEMEDHKFFIKYNNGRKFEVTNG